MGSRIHAATSSQHLEPGTREFVVVLKRFGLPSW
jgi:hypothetical protein